MPPVEILGLIPARGGSKGVPGKNKRILLCGQPLVAYTFAAAKASELLTRIVLSTDDPEIATLGHDAGVEVPCLRPPELAQDDTPMLAVVQHLLRYLLEAEGYRPDIVVLLQPTSPLRQPWHIDAALTILLNDPAAEAVVSVTEVPARYNPYYALFVKDGRLHFFQAQGAKYTRRQDLPKFYTRNGAIYACRWVTLMEKNSFYGDDCRPYVMSEAESVNIDSQLDFRLAEVLLMQEVKYAPNAG
jgi:CMP-N-acetylneuraminic acid synthetase